MTIAVLGTGRMGTALARAFIKDGSPTVVWYRTADKATALAAIGATVAASVLEAVKAAAIVVVNLRDYKVSRDLLRDKVVAGALRGKVVVELTSGSPRDAREAAQWAEVHGVGYLDGAIMATPNFIGTDRSRRLFDSKREAICTLGNIQHVGEDLGSANALDSALLGQMWGALFGGLHAIALCQAEQISLEEFAQQRAAFAPVVEGALLDLIERTRAGRLAADQETLASISVHYGAFEHLLEVTAANASMPQRRTRMQLFS